jgi:hypothetical protein
MKKDQTPKATIYLFAKTITLLMNNMFFTNNNRDFERLKNFIAS